MPQADKSWTLYWRDRNLRFHSYDLLSPPQQVDDLLTKIDHDPTRIFWGWPEGWVTSRTLAGVPTAIGSARTALRNCRHRV